jgi:hypothetical protein
MKVRLLLAALLMTMTVPSFMVAQSTRDSAHERKNHVELGIFADYYRFEQPSSSNTLNFLGLGGRAGFYMNNHASIEAEMAYDFERNFSTSDNITTTLTRTRIRPLHGLFGPKFDFGSHSAFFLTGKVGFVNFSSTTATAQQGFQNAFSSIDSGNTKFAVYPGGGVEGFWGPFGLRVDVGDEIYFSGGAQNNLRVSFGPTFKF